MPGGPEYPVLGGVEYKHPLPPPTSFSGAVATPSVAPPFISSVTAVHAPTLNSLGFAAPFIASVTSVHAPTLGFSGNNVTVSVAGTYTWLCPPGVTTVHVEDWGGGGGGGGANSGGSGGGGGGAYSTSMAVPVTPGTLYTFVVGAAGPGGSGAGAATQGTSGGDSTFTGDSGVQVIAKGGTGGLQGFNHPGGQASAGSGDTKFDGGTGGKNNATGDGGGGGASGNLLSNGAAGSDAPGGGPGGAGGTGASGGGSGGKGGKAFPGTIAPDAGSSPGGGGGGAESTATGASGADGKVTISYAQIAVPFISSVTVVYAPVISSTDVRVPFISSNTVVYQPTLKVTFTGGGVSQVALEVLTSDGEPNANVSQVTLEIIVPWYKGLHVWQRS